MRRFIAPTWRGLILTACLTVASQTIAVPRADAWMENAWDDAMKFSWETMREKMNGVILGAAKVAAIQAINEQVNMLIAGGVYGQPLIITNWEEYLYTSSIQAANDYLENDWIFRSTKGKYSSVNYIGIGDPQGIVGNYKHYLATQARLATIDAVSRTVEINLEEYTPNPQTMFREGDFRAFNAFVSNPANNPFGYTILAEQAYRAKLAEELRIAEIKAQSSGFLGVEQNGITVTPAASIEAMATNVQNMANMFVSTASNPEELVTGVATALATRMVTQLVRQGIGQVGAKVQREVNQVRQQVNTAINDATGQLGPAAPYVNAAVRNGVSNIRINPNTPAPPTPVNERVISQD